MKELKFVVDARSAPASIVRDLAALLQRYPGDVPVYLQLETSTGSRTYKLGPKVYACPEFHIAVRELLGVEGPPPRKKKRLKDRTREERIEDLYRSLKEQENTV